MHVHIIFSTSLLDCLRRELEGDGRLLLDPLDLPHPLRVRGQRRLRHRHRPRQPQTGIPPPRRRGHPRHRLLPMGPLYSYSSGVKLTKSWFQCISQTLLVRQPSSTPRAGFGNPVRGVSWLPLVGFENYSPHTNIIIDIISTIILFLKPFMMSRTRWKQKSSLEGGDGRLGGEGTEG